MRTDLVPLSRRLSKALRHHPASLGLTLDDAGWATVDAVLTGLARGGAPVDRPLLERVVRDNDKQRFELDGDRIRARQGHSVDVELGYTAADPPETLFHGTARGSLASIRATGLDRRSRHAVHLSADEATARKVGGRHGEAVVLQVRAKALADSGGVFHVTGNGVWLVDAVPVAFLVFPAAG